MYILFRRRERKGKKSFKRILAENFPNLGKEIDIQIQESQKIQKKDEPPQIHTKTQYNQIVKSQKWRDNFKVARQDWLVIYKGTPMGLSADFSAETLHARRVQDDIFKVLKEKNTCWTRIIPGKIVIQK